MAETAMRNTGFELLAAVSASNLRLAACKKNRVFGDKVKVEMMPYDLSKGSIIYRLNRL